MNQFKLTLVFLSVISLTYSSPSSSEEKYYETNSFDTYNADKCHRVRRAWSSLSDSEKQSYANAMLKLREMGGGDPSHDDVVAVASEHMEEEGELEHRASQYLFWHGYLLWEMESRIRALGGEYECFGMPYWDWTTEVSRSTDTLLIFDNDVNHLGGVGNTDDAFTVNEYSWPGVSVRDYWVPTHCTAEGDEYPFCSLKRSCDTSLMYGWKDVKQLGHGIIENADFVQFSKWYGDAINLPHDLLTADESLHFPVVTSYDPIWYLFHSMVSYHQGIWQDCHDYDQIDPDDLDQFTAAYSPFCDNSWCGDDMSLDGAFNFGGQLTAKPWSFVHDQDLTVRKSYHQPRWNVLYDLGDGQGFFTDSGLKDFCKGRLNKKWFALNVDEEEEQKEGVYDAAVSGYVTTGAVFGLSYSEMLLAITLISFVSVGAFWCLQTGNAQKMNGVSTTTYGSV